MKLWLKLFIAIMLSFALSITAFGFTDADGDGMDDAWETKYGLDPENPMDADLDMDGDKISNLNEFKKGTDPKEGADKDGNGIPDDWERFYFARTGNDPKGDPDGDGFGNLLEFKNGTNPLVADKKGDTKSEFKRPNVVFDGVRDNTVSGFKYVTGKNVIQFRDPIGDDKGPGYYTYPTNPVYVKGGFDILSVEIDGSSSGNVVFRITMNADVKQEWGMAADFDVQFVQIYIDTDGAPGSGNIDCLPGMNLRIHPDNAWDKCVLISPQPESRVRIEVESKAKDFEEAVVVPKKVVGQGRTLIATVSKKDLGIDEKDDITKWKYQVFMQSNEGFPDKDSVLTRDVNDYNGLHRFGGGSDYWGDPQVMDMLAFPAKGGTDEAKRQFEILNVWESYADPTLDIRAVVPMVWADMDKATDTTGLAAELAKKLKPKPKGDKYVSDNFFLYGKVFTRWNWNLDATKENFIKNSLELAIDGKVFTDKIDFYIRFEQAKWDETIWSDWANDTPGQNAVALQAQKMVLVNPLATIEAITLGNYEVNYSPWVMGGAWYPDRDKYKGIFVDGNIKDGTAIYKAGMFYNLKWLSPMGNNFGNAKGLDFTYAAKVNSSRLVKNLDFAVAGVVITDFELNPVKSVSPSTVILHTWTPGIEINAEYKLPLNFSIGGVLAYSEVKLGGDWKKLETGAGIDYDGSGGIADMKKSINNMDRETAAGAYVLNLKNPNLFGTGLNLHMQYFNIDENYCAPGAARGDTAFGSGGFGTSSTAATADVLAMIGNQSAHRAPQAADFLASVPLPALPSDFMVPDPQLDRAAITWVNDNWDGIAAAGWKGATAVVRYAADVWRLHAELSYIAFNDSTLTNFSKLRGYAAFNYSFLNVGRGLTLTASCMWEQIIQVNKLSKTENFVQRWYDGGSLYLSPAVGVEYNFTKAIIGSFTFRREIGSVDTADPALDTKSFGRSRFGMTFNMNTPLGFIKTRGEYWVESESVSFPGRALKGMWAITEWEYAF